MFWADQVAEEIIKTGKHKQYWVDDMFTPSGFAHVGSLRGPLVHDMVFKALRDKVEGIKWTYIMNDFDPIDGLPKELESSSKYLGVPLRIAPSPFEGFSSFAEFFAKDFQKVLRDLGVEAEFLSSYDMYQAGKFNEVIKTALDNSEKIQDIYQKVSGSKKKDSGWLPLQVICEKCGKLGTTRVHNWDGKTVAYTCEPEMVKWAQGCGYTGRVSPFDGKGKLPWKVDWPAHWKVLGITIEGAGKDHSSAGGSRDIAKELCKDVFDYPNPFNIPYEFFLIGGKKMSSSKGLGLKARELTDLLPAEIGRFLFTRTDYKRAIEFDPVGTLAIPNLFDEYQKAAEAYFTQGDEELARSFELAQIGEIKHPPEIRFSVLAQWVQMPNMEQKIKEGELSEWAKYARTWVENYAPESDKFIIQKELPKKVITLSREQKTYLASVAQELFGAENAEDFQKRLYDLSQEMNLKAKEAFSAIYLSLLGKDHGPKAAWLLLSLDKAFVTQRLKDASESRDSGAENVHTITQFTNPEMFSLSPIVKVAYPTISVGVAVIKGVTVKNQKEELEKEKQALVEKITGMTTEQIGEFPEIKSYRQLYKAMSVDWHSRRPSPEALLRRIIQGKGFPAVNTLVDAYNLVVVEHRVSVGAFDLDSIHFPTELRFPKEEEEILLLGDTEPTTYKETELAYFDQAGGYNIDFNYRDAKRTAVTHNTKNIILNVDGVFAISPEKVEEVLQAACEMIIKYCGGKVTEFGVVTAA